MKRMLGALLPLCLIAALADDYGAKVDSLLAGLGSENVGELKKAEDALFAMCAQAGAPGSEGRAAACEAIASRLAKAVPSARVWMLRQLERSGRAESVAAVAAQLSDADERVRESARRALQANPAPEAAGALAKALEAADIPAWRAALLDALAGHGAAAAPFLKAMLKSLASGETDERRAAAGALGRTGDAGAAEALLGAGAADACLALGDRLAAKGDKAAALGLFRKLYGRPGPAKGAALIGLARAGGASEIETVVAAMGDADAALRGAAVEAIVFIPAKDAVSALLAKLKGASKDLTVSLLRALGLVGDKAAVPALLAALGDADEEVRTAAARSLGSAADGSAVLPLLKAAAGGGAARDAARVAIDRISGREADEALLAALKDADAKVRAEAARALGVRRVSTAVASLLKVAEESDPAVRALIFKALSNVVKGEDLPALAAVVAKTSDASDEAAAAILAAAAQIPDADRRADAVVAECGKATGPGKLALWGVLGRLGGPKALEVLRAGVKDPDGEAQKAAVRAMGLWPDTGAAEDLLALGKGAPGETLKVLALRGYIRLAGLAKGRPAEAVKMFRTALEAATRPDEKRLALGGLGEVFDLEALKMIEPLLDDAALKEEAAAAAVAVSVELVKKNPDDVRRVLEKVVTLIKGGPALQKAISMLGKLNPGTGTLDVRLTNDPNGEKGVNFAYYEGDWDALPDFGKLTPKKTGKGAGFDIGKRDRDDGFAFKFTGFLKIAEKGAYAFSTASDDGSRLLIGDKVVVNNDGCHGVEEAMGRIDLDAGLHPITVLYFEKGGGEELHVRGGKVK
jgi:HEAT repeat protein